jgi:curli biogenesis system outer membrane secretion channel CsgG
MRPLSLSAFMRCFAFTFLLGGMSLAQGNQKPRIAVFPFDDRTTSNKDMSIGTKVADLLIAKLTTNGAFAVYDRQYVDRILAEKARKYDPNYDSAAAAKSGLMGTVDMVVSGQIDAFNANQNQVTSGKLLSKHVETDGSVVLKVTARLISVERGSIVMAPSANTEQKGVLSQSDTYAPILTKHLPGSKETMDVNQQKAISSTDQALRKLVDEAADDVTKQLAGQVAQAAVNIPIAPAGAEAAALKTEPHAGTTSSTISSATSTTTEKAAFAGISDGLAYIDKGSAAGVKKGQRITIRRNVDTGLKNGAGEPILRHKNVCTLVISVVEDTSAAGKCAPDPTAHGPDGVPKTGDDVVMAAAK